MSGVQNNTSEEPSKDPEVQTSEDNIQKASRENKQGDDDVPHYEDSPETDDEESNEAFSSANKCIEDVLQQTEEFKETLKKEIETTKREIYGQLADTLTESLLPSIQGAVEELTDFFLEILNKHLCDVKEQQTQRKKELQDKEYEDMEAKTQQDSEFLSQPAYPSGLTKIKPPATCVHNDQGQSTDNESGTIESDVTSGDQNIRSGQSSKDPEDSPETDVKESKETFSSVYKHIEDVLQETEGFKKSVKNQIETAKREICEQSADPETRRLLLSIQDEVETLTNSFLESQNKHVCGVHEKVKKTENKQQVMKKESKGQVFQNWISRHFQPPYKVLVIEVVSSVRTGNTQEMFLNELSKKLRNHNITIQMAQLDNESRNLVLLFCPVVSRTGTEIGVALKKVSSHKKIILVVMHRTPNPEYIVADSSRFVDQKNVVVTVDCLFYETTGLLNCNLNKETSQKLCYFISSFI